MGESTGGTERRQSEFYKTIGNRDLNSIFLQRRKFQTENDIIGKMTGKKGAPPQFQTNDRIFAKVKGYPAWPACVTGPNDAKGTRYKVYFYGTYETAVVKREEMWFFNEKTKEKFGKQKRKGFAEAIDEIENRPEVGYLTEELLPAVNEALEGGTSGDTILEPEDPGLDASTIEDEEPLETVVAKTEEPVTPQAAPSPIPDPAPLAKPAVTQPAKKGAKRKASSDIGDDSPALTPVAKQAKMNTSTPVAAKQPKNTSTPVAAKQSKTKIKTETSTPVAKPIKAVISTPIVAPSPTITTPVASSANEEKTSRSGRVIKPKKFEDDDSENQKNAVMRWMKMEKRIVDLDIAIRSALHHEEPDMARSLALISELHSLAIQPLMLKKLPNIVMTLRKVRKYIGPKTTQSDPKAHEKRLEDMQKIRLTSETTYKKFQSLFNVPPDVGFSKYFQKMVDEFQIATKDYDKEELFQLLVDPTLVA